MKFFGRYFDVVIVVVDVNATFLRKRHFCRLVNPSKLFRTLFNVVVIVVIVVTVIVVVVVVVGVVVVADH